MSRQKSKQNKVKRVKLTRDHITMRRQLKKIKKEFKNSEVYSSEHDIEISKANTIKKFDKFKTKIGIN